MFFQQRIRRVLTAAVVFGCALLATMPAHADVKLPAIISSHMVLQQNMPVPIWGWADAGEEVAVSFGAQRQTARADEKGHWQVKLAPLTASDQPATLTVSGKNNIELKDILVGEVWLCSGQSNMAFTLQGAINAKKEAAEANYPNIRLFTVGPAVRHAPVTDAAGRWEMCDPPTANRFSAVGYFFGRDIHKELKVPVGLIHSSWGGTVAEAWTERSHLEGEADFAAILERYVKPKETYEEQLVKWEAAVAAAKAAAEANALVQKNAQPGGKPPQFVVVKPPGKKPDPNGNPNQPSVLYNGMINPLVPFAIKGAIWYQGESNASRAYQYRKLLPAMIKSWRDVWSEPGMDFYIVSLANFMSAPKAPGDDDWAELREAQAMTAALPHNGLALAIDLADLGNPGDIHPKNKQDVGHRLALVALAKTYGKPRDYSGPQFTGFKIDGSRVIIEFNFSDGLTAKGGSPLQGFQIAGQDKTWHWADAKIAGSTVIISSKEVENPAAVRYDWSHNPQGNLYNRANLPAVPFRTDDWNGVTAGKN